MGSQPHDQAPGPEATAGTPKLARALGRARRWLAVVALIAAIAATEWLFPGWGGDDPDDGAAEVTAPAPVPAALPAPTAAPVDPATPDASTPDDDTSVDAEAPDGV